MRRTTVAAAPTAAAATTAAAVTTAAAAVSFRLYDYFSLQCNYKPHPRRSGRHELMDGTIVIFLLKFSMFMQPELPPPRPPPRPSINYTLFYSALLLLTMPPCSFAKRRLYSRRRRGPPC
jgi:hypothetical protein